MPVLNLPAPDDVRSELRRVGFVVISDAIDRAAAAWLSQATSRLIERAGTAIDRGAGTPERLAYRVVSGDRILLECHALFDIYASSDLIDWVRSATDTPAITMSPHVRSGINVNCLSHAGQRYRWHVDAVPYTVVMFLTSVPTAAGGQLQIVGIDGAVVAIQPRAGGLVLMDGARCPHGVAPLKQSIRRITVPMVYPAHLHARPAGLDEFLYGHSHQ